MYTILICDDQPDIVNALRLHLMPEGYAVRTACTGQEALELVRTERIDLILLDIMMPKMDGITATARIRTFSNVPIILVTAKSESADLILGLNTGADDYVTKPFVPAELLARVRSALRRSDQLNRSHPAGQALLQVGNICLDPVKKQVFVDGEHVGLTPVEYRILHLLMNHPGHTFPTLEIYQQVWQEPALDNAHVVAVHIRHLREKLEVNPSEPRHLKAVWGRGYKLEGA